MHFLEAAVPKDGPSAGIAICTAYLSLLLDRPVRTTVAMTGEISLNGDVCKIGGLNAKLIASKSLKIDTIIVPYANKGEIMELSPKLLEGFLLRFLVREVSQKL